MNVRFENLELVNGSKRRTLETEGEGTGLVDGLGSTQSGLRALRKFDESSPRRKEDEELLVVAILSTLGLWPGCCWAEFDEVDEGVAEVVLNLRDDDSDPFPPSKVSARKLSLLPVPFEP